MDLMESLRTLRRRWILTSVLLLLTLAGAVGAVVKLPWTYQSQGMIALLASQSASKQSGGNPYLAFSQSLTDTADLVRREVMDPNTALALSARGQSATYLVTAASDTSGPVLLVTVTGTNKNTVENTLHGAMDEVNTKLVNLQAGISSYNRITSLVVYTTPKATLSVSKKARPLVVVLAAGLALTFAIPQLVDAQAIGRRARRATGGQAELSYPDDHVDDGRRSHANGLVLDRAVPDRADADRAVPDRTDADRADADRSATGTPARYDLDPGGRAPVSRFRSR